MKHKEIWLLQHQFWVKGILLPCRSKKNYKVFLPAHTIGGCIASTVYVSKERCAFPNEKVCVVWEMWRGPMGGYRVERESYTKYRIPANKVAYTPGCPDPDRLEPIKGRVTEEQLGILNIHLSC